MFETAKCGHCGKSGTKLAQIEPSGARSKLNAVTCSWCSAILGITSYYDTGTQVEAVEKKVESLNRDVHSVQNSLNQLLHLLQR